MSRLRFNVKIRLPNNTVFFCLLFLIIVILSGCGSKHFLRRKLYYVCSKAQQVTASPHHWITIWVHGADPFKLKTHHVGLYHAKDVVGPKTPGSVARELSKADPVRYAPEKLYVYSWSGALDFGEREQAAQKLHDALQLVVRDYTRIYNSVPKIRIIAHSHGGNVALNLARAQGNPILIDELVLMGVPVQEKTYACAQSACFKRIFSFYTTCDITQIIDPQGFYRQGCPGPFFSQRRFKAAENILHVKIKWNGHAIDHLDYNGSNFTMLMPIILDQLNEWFDAIPSYIKRSEQSSFMLSLYTNGRMPPEGKRYYTQGEGEHVIVPVPFKEVFLL